MTPAVILALTGVLVLVLVALAVIRMGAVASDWKNGSIEVCCDSVIAKLDTIKALPAEEQIAAMREYLEYVRQRAADGNHRPLR